MSVMGVAALRGRTVALLGPTNTGKTHLAVETMLSHASGIIGFPLRLLAREVYERVVARVGRNNVALVTGEEKIVPPNPHYFLCTVEAMPTGRSFDFLAVDEIQLAADPERGHVFTDRLLRARGVETTMFLGASTARPMIQRLLPDVTMSGRPRLSTLKWTGETKLSRLPRRTAVVAFSASDVYAVAELMRRQRGGAAVVLGALSPRARNAQVAMYQAGEVDFLVATDAIGMGLNMDIDHVAFAATHKFDGLHRRALTPAELGQIAGRAGRFMRDGTFGITGGVDGPEPEVIAAVENHTFEPLKRLRWRSAALDFTNPKALLRSLEAPPPFPGLIHPREPEDQRSLKSLMQDEDLMRRAERNPENLHRLWDVCQIPDFRKTMHDGHVRLVGQVFRQLCDDGRIARDWIARQMDHVDRVDGDIDTLQTRIAHVRTWSFISHRAEWLDDPAEWQGRARTVEDRLSDALHERLTQRFVDRRTAALVNRLRDREEVDAAIDADGTVTVSGQFVGRLDGLRFVADRSAFENKALKGALLQVLGKAVRDRARDVADAKDADFALDDDGTVRWRGAGIGRLQAGDHVLRPRIRVAASDQLEGKPLERVRERVDLWLEHQIASLLRPLVGLEELPFSPAGRGIAFQLVERLGVLPRSQVAEQLRRLDPKDHGRFKYRGVHVGRFSIHCPALLKPEATRWRIVLHALSGAPVARAETQGRVSFDVEKREDRDALLVAGYERFGTTAVRVDMVERIAGHAWKATREGPAEADHELMSMLGGGAGRLGPILHGLGYRTERTGEDGPLVYQPRGNGSGKGKDARPRRDRDRGGPPPDPDSPFAALALMRKA
ncbi:MAG: helicase-related protein [Pseudomonadota bacterium]|nr:helicase-related protein [Pseudomonadota bacterium]